MLATMLCDSESWTLFYVWESLFGDINNRLNHGGELTRHYVQPTAAKSLPEVVWKEKVWGELTSGWKGDQICHEAIEDLKIAN